MDRDLHEADGVIRGVMEIVNRRILTMRSKIGMGRYADIPIERVLDIAPNAVRYAYYRYDVIDFTAEVKEAAQIRIDIPKPGHDYDKYWENEQMIRGDLTDEERIKRAAMFRRGKRVTDSVLKHGNALGHYMSKGYLQAANHGRAKIKK